MKEDKHIDAVRRYFDACDSGVLEDFKPTLADDVVHYFLPDRFAPIRGADHLARFWRNFKQVSNMTKHAMRNSRGSHIATDAT